MSEEVRVSVDEGQAEKPATQEARPQQPGEGNVKVSCPPPAEQPPRSEDDAGVKLHRMARELMRTRSRKLLLEYLRLRRSIR